MSLIVDQCKVMYLEARNSIRAQTCVENLGKCYIINRLSGHHQQGLETCKPRSLPVKNANTVLEFKTKKVYGNLSDVLFVHLVVDSWAGIRSAALISSRGLSKLQGGCSVVPPGAKDIKCIAFLFLLH